MNLRNVAVAQSVRIDIGGTKTLALAVSSDGTIRAGAGMILLKRGRNSEACG